VFHAALFAEEHSAAPCAYSLTGLLSKWLVGAVVRARPFGVVVCGAALALRVLQDAVGDVRPYVIGRDHPVACAFVLPALERGRIGAREGVIADSRLDAVPVAVRVNNDGVAGT